MIDNKNGLDKTKQQLNSFDKGKYLFIVEKDAVNRTSYDSSYLFIPDDLKLLIKDTGYELYEN